MSTEMNPFFLGERVVDKTVISLHRGKARLSCSVVEQWIEILFIALSCGNSQTRRVTRRIGLSREDVERLETTVKSSLGLSNVAQLASAIKTGISTVSRFEQVTEVEQIFKFAAPRCGRQSTQVFQLARRYDLTYEDIRFWHRDYWKHSITEWCDRIHDESKRSPYDPACNCRERRESKPQGVAYLRTNGVTMLVGIDRSSGSVWMPSEVISTPEATAGQPVKVTIKSDLIPEYLRFLGGIEDPTAECELVSGPQLAQLYFGEVDPRARWGGERKSLIVDREAFEVAPTMVGQYAAVRKRLAARVLTRTRSGV